MRSVGTAEMHCLIAAAVQGTANCNYSEDIRGVFREYLEFGTMDKV
jgi:hypothetical protein